MTFLLVYILVLAGGRGGGGGWGGEEMTCTETNWTSISPNVNNSIQVVGEKHHRT